MKASDIVKKEKFLIIIPELQLRSCHLRHVAVQLICRSPEDQGAELNAWSPSLTGRSVVRGSWVSYHSIVLRSPSSRVTRAWNPKLSEERETSSVRRGWPSGLSLCQRMSPSKCVRRAISCNSSEILISFPLPR